jgi:hypothetical protein
MAAATATVATTAAEIPTTLIRASVQGTVYLIDSPTGRVYTYNLENPTWIGTLEKIAEKDKHLISKTNGCLANAIVRYRPDVKEIMARLRTGVAGGAGGL